MGHSPDERPAGIESQLASLIRFPICQDLLRIVGRRETHLVGGALRDIALGRQPRDIDVIVAGDGTSVAQSLADRFDTRYVRLGGNRFAAYRVTTDGLPIDIWDRGASSLDADLRRRDFTIHSFALDLHTAALYDPYHGIHDLTERRLRMTTSASFAKDPLRVLRLCRLKAQFDTFRIDSATRDKARESVTDLTGIAKERIRTELELTLTQQGVAPAIELWIELGILPRIIQGLTSSPAQLQQIEKELSPTLRALEQTAENLPSLVDLFAPRVALMLILLNQTSTRPGAAAVGSLQQMGYMTKARARQVSRLLEAGELPVDESGQRWFLYRMGDLWPAALTLSAALSTRAGGAETESSPLAAAIELATEKAEEVFNPPVLITGEELQNNLRIEPGPFLGRILAAIRRQQIEGGLATRTEALDLARRLNAAGSAE
jgi:poly(A) polymerase